MARLKPKEFDPTMLLTIQKHKADSILNAEKAGEKIGKEKVEQDIAGYKEDASSWLKNWRTERGLPADSGVLPNNRDEVPPHLRGWIFPRADASPKDGMKIAGDLGPGDMSHVTEGGFYLTGEDGIHGHVYQNEGGYLKEGNMYDQGIHGLPIPLVDKMKINKGQQLAMNPADIPLGDGLINEAMTNVQNSNKQKYDLMYQEGFINRQQYEKQMKRTFGKKYQQYLVD